jgi:hypothetical protein
MHRTASSYPSADGADLSPLAGVGPQPHTGKAGPAGSSWKAELPEHGNDQLLNPGHMAGHCTGCHFDVEE